MNKFAKSLLPAVLVSVGFGSLFQSTSASAVPCPAYGEDVGTNQPSNPYCNETYTDSNGNQSTRLSQDVFYYYTVDGRRLVVRCTKSQNACQVDNAPLGNEQPFVSVPTVHGGESTTTTTVPSSGGSVSTTVPSSGGSTSNSVPKITTTTTEVPAVNDDGESEDDFADVGLSSVNGKFNIRISSSFGGTEMILRAYKKNSKSVTWVFTTYKTGSYRILTSRDLKRFTISLWIDGEKWDSLVVR